MKKLGSFLGATVAGYAGWWLAESLGFDFLVAFIVSTIASGVGMYYGKKLAEEYLE